MDDYEDLDLPDDLKSIEEILSSNGVLIGELYDVEEF